jgi:hypothetical protein
MLDAKPSTAVSDAPQAEHDCARASTDATFRSTMSAPAETSPNRPHSWIARIADRFGATASFLCAVHCAALPFVIALLPALGLSFLADHRFERGFITFASALALTTLILGFRRHRQFRAFWFLVPGIVLLTSGILVDSDQSTSLHALLVAAGGTLVALSHLTNLRLAHVHVHSAACEH